MSIIYDNIDRDLAMFEENDTYDEAGRLISESRPEDAESMYDFDSQPIGTTTYTYDNDNQLLSTSDTIDGEDGGVGSQSYAYDENGNRGSSGATVSADNEVTWDGLYSYTYDHDGNLIQKAGMGITWDFTYDYRNRLTEVVQSGEMVTDSVYTYDTQNRRISQVVTSDGTYSTVSMNERYVYESGTNNLLAILDGSTGEVTQRLLNGLNPNQVFAQEAAGTGKTYWFQTDHEGTVTDMVTDTEGAHALDDDHIVYDAYGNVISHDLGDGEGPSPVEYASMRLDPTGLYYDGARYYDPVQGRFITQDPSGAAGSGTNLYAYTANNPVTRTDPTGLSFITGASAAVSNSFSFGPTLSFESSYETPISTVNITSSNSFNSTADYDVLETGHSITSGTAASSGWNMSASLGITNSFNPLSSQAINGIEPLSVDSGSALSLAGTVGFAVQQFASLSANNYIDASYVNPSALPTSTTFLNGNFPFGIAPFSMGSKSDFIVSKTVGSDSQGTSFTYNVNQNYNGDRSGLDQVLDLNPADSMTDLLSRQTFHNLTPDQEQKMDLQYNSTVANLKIAQSANAMQAMVVGMIGGPEFGVAGAAAEALPSSYSVAFETQLAPEQFGLRQAQHFQIANDALQVERASNPALSNLVPAPAGWGRPPADWTWQHATIEQANGNAGVLQLVPRYQHTPGSPFWPLLHPLPGGAGGYSQWAIPAGAPPR